MKNLQLLPAALVMLSVAVVIIPLSPRATSSTTTTSSVYFDSDTSWQVLDGDPALGPANLLGAAQLVCLNAFYPSPCPAGATLYGWTGSGWGTDLSSIPGAMWIWAPNVTGSTFPAELNQFYFSKSLQLRGQSYGSISIAVDDFAEVRVNGQVVGTTGSIVSFSAAVAAQHALATFDLTSFLVPGNNTITIHAENGPFGVCCPSYYSGNPAGVVFGGSLTIPSISSTPDIGPPGTKVLVQGSGLPPQQSSSSQLLMSFDDQFLGFATYQGGGSFSFTFSVPLSEAGSHIIKAADVILGIQATTGFQVEAVTSQLSLSVTLGVGAIYFPGETAQGSILVTSGGSPVGPDGVTIQATLTRPDNSTFKLNATSIAPGVYKVSYPVPKTASIGTYSLVVVAHMSGAGDSTALVAFEVKQSWLAAQGPAITVGAISTAGLLGTVAVVWKKRLLQTTR